MTDCTIIDNHSPQSGGGINSLESDPTLIRCSFIGNESGNQGGGLCNWNISRTSTTTLVNCDFSGNSALSGGGVNSQTHDTLVLDLTNCSFSGNEAGRDGGGIFNYARDGAVLNCTLCNCILWGDCAAHSMGEIYNYGGDSVGTYIGKISYCDIERCGSSGIGWDSFLGIDGGKNIDTNPMFVDQPDYNDAPTTDGDLHIQEGSLCIDVGDNGEVATISTDWEGDNRIIDGDKNGSKIVDMGADEFRPEHVKPVGGEAEAVNVAMMLLLLAGMLLVASGAVVLRRRTAHS